MGFLPRPESSLFNDHSHSDVSLPFLGYDRFVHDENLLQFFFSILKPETKEDTDVILQVKRGTYCQRMYFDLLGSLMSTLCFFRNGSNLPLIQRSPRKDWVSVSLLFFLST